MRVLFWVQHLLGTGHLRRALTLAEAMAGRGLEVTLASGGPPVDWRLPSRVGLVQLPPLHAGDHTFAHLLDADGRPAGEALWARRRESLLELFEQVRPRLLMTEMFPFGRRAFRAELLPLLEAAALARPRVWRLASVRDVLVRKDPPERSGWMRDAALAHYDRVLVHGDPAVMPFELTFPHAKDLGQRLISTGYVAPPAAPPSRSRRGHGEVLVSAGGGRVGRALLESALQARPLSRACRHARWRLVAGAGLPEADFAEIGGRIPQGVVLEREREDFQELLADSLLSVSQAGYNTVVEALRYHKPMILVPFETAIETEQRLRAERLAELGLAVTVPAHELDGARLARAIDAAAAGLPPSHQAIDLDGAARTAELALDLAGRPDLAP